MCVRGGMRLWKEYVEYRKVWKNIKRFVGLSRVAQQGLQRRSDPYLRFRLKGRVSNSLGMRRRQSAGSIPNQSRSSTSSSRSASRRSKLSAIGPSSRSSSASGSRARAEEGIRIFYPSPTRWSRSERQHCSNPSLSIAGFEGTPKSAVASVVSTVSVGAHSHSPGPHGGGLLPHSQLQVA